MRTRSLAVMLLSAAAGCASLDSVSATAELGRNLQSHGPALNLMDEHCRLLVSAGLQSRCPARTEKWLRAADMVADYARRLGELAGGEDPSVADELAATLDSARRAGWLELTRDTDRTLSEAAGKIAAFLRREYRRGEIGKVVRDVHPSLALVLELILRHLAVEREQLAILRCQVACAAGTPYPRETCPDTPASACEPPADPAPALAMSALSAELTRRAGRIDQAARAVAAFGRAHQRLYENSGRLGDRALYEQILKDVFGIYAAVKPAS